MQSRVFVFNYVRVCASENRGSCLLYVRRFAWTAQWMFQTHTDMDTAIHRRQIHTRLAHRVKPQCRNTFTLVWKCSRLRYIRRRFAEMGDATCKSLNIWGRRSEFTFRFGRCCCFCCCSCGETYILICALWVSTATYTNMLRMVTCVFSV